MSDKPRIFGTPFGDVYPMYVQKAERKGRTAEEVESVTCWLTGYDENGLRERLGDGTDVETFFVQAPQIHPNAHKITVKVCGVHPQAFFAKSRKMYGQRVETIDDPIMKNIRRLGKLVDELAKGKAMEKVLRT